MDVFICNHHKGDEIESFILWTFWAKEGFLTLLNPPTGSVNIIRDFCKPPSERMSQTKSYSFINKGVV